MRFITLSSLVFSLLSMAGQPSRGQETRWPANPCLPPLLLQGNSAFFEGAHLALARLLGFPSDEPTVKKLKGGVRRMLLDHDDRVLIWAGLAQGDVHLIYRSLVDNFGSSEVTVVQTLPQILLDLGLVVSVPEHEENIVLQDWYYLPGRLENTLRLLGRIRGSADSLSISARTAKVRQQLEAHQPKLRIISVKVSDSARTSVGFSYEAEVTFLLKE